LGHYFKKTKWFKQSPEKKKDILMRFPLWLEKEIKGVDKPHDKK
jgi:hypothetical protein